MSNIDKQALREAAEKALQGNWDYEARAIWNTSDSGNVQHMAAVDAGDDISDEEHKSNMRFITLATPAVVRDLLDELSESQAGKANESSCADSTINLAINWQIRCKDAEAKLEVAEKRIAELEAIAKSVKFDPIPMEDLGNKSDGKKHPYMFGAGYNSAVVHCESVLLQAFAAAAGKGYAS